jgi:hypothetical protein
MLKIITTLTVFLIGILAKGQVVENRNLSEFSKVAVANGIELIYNEDQSTSLRIAATNAEILKNTITEVDGKTLNIYLTEGTTLTANDMVKVYLSTKNITALSANTNAKITILNQLNTKNLSINLDSGATLTGNIKALLKTKLRANDSTVFNGKIETSVLKGKFSDNAKINLTGQAKKAAFQTNDIALLHAKNFIADNIYLNANGKSVAMIHANNNIALNVSENAKILYTGFPETIKMNEEAQAYKKLNNDHLVSYK